VLPSTCLAVALLALAAGCGSQSAQDAPAQPSPTFGSGGNGAGYTCVPDTDAGVAPKSDGLQLGDGTTPGGTGTTCAPGTHAVPTSLDAGPPVGVAGGEAGSKPPPGPPGPLPPMPALCTAGGANNEPKILVGYAPANGQTVGANGKIRVWINDEGAPIIAPNEQIDPATGTITTPGDRTAKAPDGYLWEPALYIAPQTAENGGTPHFPTAIKGSYNNTTQKGGGALVPGMDPVPAGSVSSQAYTGEDIWDVSSLGLAPGTYIAEFVIHDGDRDRGVGCVTIVIN
jgi:hypothetical protein